MSNEFWPVTAVKETPLEKGAFWFTIETTGAICSFDMSKMAMIDLMYFIAKHCRGKILSVKASATTTTSLGYLQFIRATNKIKQFLQGCEAYEHEYIDDLENFEVCDNIHPDHIWDRTWNLFT